MGLALSSVETELKSRSRNIGVFNAADSVDRLRYAILRGLVELSNHRDWTWLNKTASIATTEGTLGPYTAPSLFMRLATLHEVAVFGYVDKNTLAPIMPSTTTIYMPYFRIQDSSIYFFNDPGSNTLTLNYVAEITDSIIEADLIVSVALVPNGLKPALLLYAGSDLLTDLPSGDVKAEAMRAKARFAAEEYWHQSTLQQTQRGISPKGLNKVSIDNHASGVSVLSFNYGPWNNVNA